ncbi:uncharacterized protein DUF4956 [Flavobacterium cauense R2A-7]|uniref:Uncharacterized protein DUF4956 n=1 Tax=Flavobacterium cauense R2A-7 TaxID=1341154 RepID=A0A562M1C9_9FLAO|nr:DUF4956 domain-containing protein [Flavobacterium cauense]KGO81691.1 hypothetical protein Q762_07540 [Flavobacterium cauense R2A-7]TWI13719.1 uncharacterized protein DUF4956 [Flavobacterium cauense R2A-7]
METEEALISAFNTYDFIVRSAIDFIAVALLVGFIYYPKHRNKDFIFTFILFNVVNFMICCLLGAVKIKIGFAFGLFAMFSIIRYRTIAISIKDMGYFFVCVAMGMLNSLAFVDDNYTILIICNIVVLFLTFILERLDFLKNENAKEIVYDKVELIKPEYREQLLYDLNERTGLNIHRIEVISIDYLKDTALLKAFYYAKESEYVLPTSDDND